MMGPRGCGISPSELSMYISSVVGQRNEHLDSVPSNPTQLTRSCCLSLTVRRALCERHGCRYSRSPAGSTHILLSPVLSLNQSLPCVNPTPRRLTMFKLATFVTVALGATAMVSGAAVPRDHTPSSYNTAVLEVNTCLTSHIVTRV